MRIHNARPVQQAPTPRGFRTLARFQLEPCDGVRIYDCLLIEAPDGRLLVYGPPAKNDAPTISLSPEMRRTAIAMMLEEGFAHDRCRAA